MNRPREDWPRLASYVISARLTAGYKDRQEFSEATGITARTLGKLETGHPVSPETLATVERPLGWKPDSARMILAGGEPEAVAPAVTREDVTSRDDLVEEAVRAAVEHYRAKVAARMAEINAEREADGRTA